VLGKGDMFWVRLTSRLESVKKQHDYLRQIGRFASEEQTSFSCFTIERSSVHGSANVQTFQQEWVQKRKKLREKHQGENHGSLEGRSHNLQPCNHFSNSSPGRHAGTDQYGPHTEILCLIKISSAVQIQRLCPS
jgi:hypothetical protein